MARASSQLTPAISRCAGHIVTIGSNDKLCLLLCTDVELALGSALVVRQEPSNTESINVVPVHDTNNLQSVVNVQPVANVQSVANVVTATTSFQQLEPSDSSTTDRAPTEGGNESQATASPGIDPDAASTLPLQPLQTTEFDVVPIQDTTSPLQDTASPLQDTTSPPQNIASPQAVVYAEAPSVSFPALHPPGVSASSNTPIYSTDCS